MPWRLQGHDVPLPHSQVAASDGGKFKDEAMQPRNIKGKEARKEDRDSR